MDGISPRRLAAFTNWAHDTFNINNYQDNLDGSVKSPDAALRFILRHCGVRKSTPHS
jgi:hypothetical protein